MISNTIATNETITSTMGERQCSARTANASVSILKGSEIMLRTESGLNQN